MNLPKAEIDRDTAMELWKTQQSEYAKEQLILANTGMVGIVIKSLNLPVYDEDLYSIGIIGLIKAVKSYDVERGFKFSTYATRVIRNEILMSLRKKTVESAFSLDDTVNIKNGERIPFSDIISDGTTFENDVLIRTQIHEILKKLPNRNQKIFIMTLQGKTQREIAAVTGLSQSYISRIIKGVLRKYET